MKKLLTSAAIATVIAGGALAGASPANAAQGGITSDTHDTAHTWVKVGRAELDQKGAQAACLSSGLGYWGCDGLVSELNSQRSRNPRANGYWAEKYYLVKTSATTSLRSGTW